MRSFKEKYILAKSDRQQGYDCYHYDVKYRGNYTEEELIKAIDSENSPFGGRVEKIYEKNGITRAKVTVYYD